MRWLCRLNAARRKYHRATTEFSKVLAEQNKWPAPAADGSTALRNARLQEAAALNEYMRTLKVFTDLLVYGKKPEAQS